MNDKPTYNRWGGVLLGFLVAGLAHFMSGKRRAGLVWYFGLLAMDLASFAVMFIPGTVSYGISVAITITGIVLWLLMLKHSYTPVPRIGVSGWIGVVTLVFVLYKAGDLLIPGSMDFIRVSSGSMQPSLLGIRVKEMRADSSERPGTGFQWIITGNRFREIKVSEGGVVTGKTTVPKFQVGRYTYELPRQARPFKMPGEYIARGKTLWSGVISYEDLLMIDKLSYRFGDPKRGDVLLFKNDGITMLPGSRVTFKRVAGLPGERIRIEPPYLIVDGRKVTTPALFQDIASRRDGHAGFMLANPSADIGARLVKATDEVVLGKDEYFVLGDNTTSSLDSRYWGPLKKKNIIGKVGRILWPFDRINALEGR